MIAHFEPIENLMVKHMGDVALTSVSNTVDVPNHVNAYRQQWVEAMPVYDVDQNVSLYNPRSDLIQCISDKTGT
jgi:hypothetical protein